MHSDYSIWLFTRNIHTFCDTSIAINRYIIWRWLYLEAYFHSDPRIVEWVNQITEKIFTVCLLTGVESEVEFQSGCQFVTKVTQLLQGISMIPSEYLEDALKQLIEQQLPDSRVISNFPTFHETMNKMLHEGMSRAFDIKNSEEIAILDENPDRSVKRMYDGFITEPVIAALASIKTLERSAATDSLIVSTDPIVPIIPTKPYGINRMIKVPEQAVRLKQVLSNIFPNVITNWNLTLMGQTFLAQVEDILICVHKDEQPCHREKFKKEGWKIYVCSSDDLMFPRRLERQIRQIKRLRK